MFKNFGRKQWRMSGVLMGAMALFVAMAVPAGAAADLKTALQAGGGADPGVAAGAAHGAVSYVAVQNRIKVALDNLDPARFPLGCVANVQVGRAKGQAALVATPAIELPLGVTAATSLDFDMAGAVAAGAKATVSIKCESVNPAGQKIKAQTLWTAVL